MLRVYFLVLWIIFIEEPVGVADAFPHVLCGVGIRTSCSAAGMGT
jgi:hypothetical protein